MRVGRGEEVTEEELGEEDLTPPPPPLKDLLEEEEFVVLPEVLGGRAGPAPQVLI